MSLLFAFLLAAQDASVDVPREMLRCPIERTADSALCRAVVAQDEDRFDASAEAFEEAASLAVNDPDKAARALLAAGNMWLAAGQAGRAGGIIDKALAMETLAGVQRGFAHLDRARAALLGGNANLAGDHLERARTLVPDDPWVWYFGAGLALEREDIITARFEIERAVALAPDSADVLLRAALIEQEGGNAEAAGAYLRRAADAAPGSEAGRSARRLLRDMAEPEPASNAPSQEEE